MQYLLFQAHSPCNFFDTDDDGLTALGVARKFGQEILAKWLASVEKDLLGGDAEASSSSRSANVKKGKWKKMLSRSIRGSGTV